MVMTDGDDRWEVGRKKLIVERLDPIRTREYYLSGSNIPPSVTLRHSRYCLRPYWRYLAFGSSRETPTARFFLALPCYFCQFISRPEL